MQDHFERAIRKAQEECKAAVMVIQGADTYRLASLQGQFLAYERALTIYRNAAMTDQDEDL